MDLGFGGSNQEVGDAAASLLLRTAVEQEKAVEREISRFDAVLDDSDALDQLRARRTAELQQQRADRMKWQALGHGSYEDLGSTNTSDCAKAFFEVAKQSPRLVVHFYRPSTRYCDAFHKHLSTLAKAHPETRFVRLNVENCETGDSNNNNGASFLVERLGIVVMPTLLIVKDRQSHHQIRGFDELGGTADFTAAALEYVLGRHGALDCDLEHVPDELLNASPRGVNTIRLTKSSRRGHQRHEDDDEDF